MQNVMLHSTEKSLRICQFAHCFAFVWFRSIVNDSNNGKKVSPNPKGTENVFWDIRVLSIHIYVLSLSCLAMGINLVRDKWPRD